MIGLVYALVNQKGTFDLSSNKVLSNVAYSFVSQIIRLAANTLLFISVARMYSSIEFGYFATAHTYYTFFILIADFGIDSYILAALPSVPSSKSFVLVNLIRTRLIFCTIAIIGMLIFGIFLSSSTETILLFFIFTVGLVGTTLTSFFLSTFKSQEIFKYDVYINIYQNGFLLIGLIAVRMSGLNYFYLAIIFMMSRYLGLLRLFRIFKDLVETDIFKDFSVGFLETVKSVYPYGVHLFFGTLYFTSDTMLIALFYGEYAVGQYQAVFKLMLFSLLFSDVVTISALPSLSKSYAEDVQDWRFIANFLFKMLAVSGIIFGGIFFYFSNDVVEIVYGNKLLENARPLMQIFGILIFIRSVTLLYGFLLTSSQNQHKRMLITIAATVFNIVLNILFLPKYGILGSAYVALVTNTLVGFLFVYFARNLKFTVDSTFLNVLILFGVFYFSMNYFIQSQIMLKLTVLVSLCCYVLYTAFFSLSKSEIKLISFFVQQLKAKIGA